MDNRPIGVFDSGFGGLSVLKELKRTMPNENYVYFGDTKRIPYGCKDKETIQRYSKEVIEFLIEKNTKAIILACNSVTANAMEFLKGKYDIPIIGIIESGAKGALKETKNNKVLVLATEATINSNVYENTIKNLKDNIIVYSKACPEFVPLVEEGTDKGDELLNISKKYYSDLKSHDYDTIILGCTHYPHIINVISEVFGKEKKYIDPAIMLSAEIEKKLKKNNIKSDSNEGIIDFYTSGNIEKFKEFGSVYFEDKIDIVKNKVF